GETPWDGGSGAPPLGELLERVEPGFWGGGTVLVPGCGAGHDVRMLAGVGLDVLGLDLSETAVKLVSGRERAGGERYEVGDFLAAGWSGGRSFSAIWEHTCYCAIDPDLRSRYARSAAEVLEPGGVLAGVFYLTPTKREGEERQPPFAVTVEALEACFAPWFECVEGAVPERAYPGREGKEWLAVFRRRA
ncbi:MAG: methyltransferase domain-containing protein, partial [Verrucomicrobiales bacterium]